LEPDFNYPTPLEIFSPSIEMVLHNPNNWHWVNKDVSPWAKDYLTEKVTQCSTEEDGVTVKISKLTSMDGDVDVSQRKGKVITIFDVKLNLEYEGW
jgi:activator of HSP90 ATPase